MDFPKNASELGRSHVSDKFFLPSTAVGRAVDVFTRKAAHSSVERKTQTTRRVIGTLAMFAPENTPDAALDAVHLMPLAEQLRRPNQPLRYAAASDGLWECFERGTPNRLRNGYLGTLLGDVRHIESFAHSYADPSRIQNPESLALLQGRTGGAPVPDEAWLNLTAGVDMPGMKEVYRSTNVEAQLALAAYALDNIEHDADDDLELFRYVNDAEAHSVFLEAAGLHAFGMQLDSAINKTRIKKSGNVDMLEFATKQLDRAKKISTEDILKQFFGTKPQEHAFRTDGASLYDESIIFSSTPLSELGNKDQDGVLHSRFKSIGKYGMKLLTNDAYSYEESRLPADVFGMYAVLPDEKQLGVFFAQTAIRMSKNDAIRPTIAPSKQAPLFIQGSPEFVDAVCAEISALAPEIMNMVETKVQTATAEKPVFEVAKFNATLTIGGEQLPTEFQFQTAAGRASARLGDTSHRGHNAKFKTGVEGYVPGDSGDLSAISVRKLKMTTEDSLLVNERSIPHGEEFRRLYLASRRRLRRS